MEFLFVIFLFSLYFFGFSKTIQWIKSFFVSTVKTAKDINDSGFDTKKIKENFKDEFYEMGPLEVRCVPKKFPVKDGTNFDLCPGSILYDFKCHWPSPSMLYILVRKFIS